MSIQGYNQPIFRDSRYYDADGKISTTGALAKTAMAMEFNVRLMCSIGGDRTAVRNVQFTVVGVKEGDDTLDGDAGAVGLNLHHMLDAGARVASNIAKVSKGVVSGFFAKLGKFRADEIPQTVAVGDNSLATIDLSNNANDEYGADPCKKDKQYPLIDASSRIYIPWLRDDVSRQDLVQHFGNWSYVANGLTFSLGQVKFADSNKIDMICEPTQYVRNIKTLNYSRKTPAYKEVNDTHMGMLTDKVVSEFMNTFDDGGVDDIQEP